MKVYTVSGIVNMEVALGVFVEVSYFYGAFSSLIKANTIADQLIEHINESDGEEEIYVQELAIDEPTEDYFMSMAI